MGLILSPLSYVLIVCVIALFVLAVFKFRRQAKSHVEDPEAVPVSPPGPSPIPVLGNLHTIGKYKFPHEAFSDLRQQYGDVYSLMLGNQKCVVVCSLETMREVLITKGPHFGGRPNFVRYNRLFGGDRDNSLALCDWSKLQKTRRNIVHKFVHPKPNSLKSSQLQASLTAELDLMVEELSKNADRPYPLKDLLLKVCANIFSGYMCSQRFAHDDAQFSHMVSDFDHIFYDINQGYALDFMPWLQPLYEKHLRQLEKRSHNIRKFILDRVIQEHNQNFDSQSIQDFVDVLIDHLRDESGAVLNWESALYELEDLLGGSSAVANFWMRVMAEVAANPQVISKIREEITKATMEKGAPLTLEDRSSLTYIEATLLETLRKTSSPIIPHVATETTTVNGFLVEEGTMMFLNNYEMNWSPEYWDDPQAFRPERFIKEGRISKPDFFMPFSTGKRACMGYRLVMIVTSMGLARLIEKYDVTLPPAYSEVLKNVQPACLALPTQTFPLTFTPVQ